MKRNILIVVLLSIMFFSVSCATKQPDRYNTQKGAAIGAGAGALMGHAIGGDAEGTLQGAVIGTLVGAISGNAVDQEHQAARDAANKLGGVSSAQKNTALLAIATGLENEADFIQAENKKAEE